MTIDKEFIKEFLVKFSELHEDVYNDLISEVKDAYESNKEIEHPYAMHRAFEHGLNKVLQELDEDYSEFAYLDEIKLTQIKLSEI